jgi:microcystin-dependent protein
MEGYIGEIRMFAGNFAPNYWAYCRGQLMSIAQYTALFSIVGTTYGGDGQVTFALPDFRGRLAVGTGQGPGLSEYTLGQLAGVEQTTLLSVNLPAHNHAISGTVTVKATGDGGTGIDPTNRNFGPGNIYTDSTTDLVDMATSNTDVRLTTASVGNNIPFNNIQPYLAMNYIICTEGIYPSRN